MVKEKSFFSSLFSSGPQYENVAVAPKRSLIIFVTDGECNQRDEERMRWVLGESEKRKDEVYFMLIGISNQGVKFEFLNEIADDFSNTGLVVIRNLREFVNKSDEEINEILITDELVDWLKK